MVEERQNISLHIANKFAIINKLGAPDFLKTKTHLFQLNIQNNSYCYSPNEDVIQCVYQIITLFAFLSL